jgi:hypothetical protein
MQSHNTTQKYFFFGSGSRYALVDTFTKSIWLMAPEETIAHSIRSLFSWSKLNLIVVDLTTYSNFNYELIDNSVCLQWQIPTVPFELLQTSVVKKIFETTVVDTESSNLINIPAPCRLTTDRQLDLQDQLMLVYKIFDAIYWSINPNYGDNLVKWAKFVPDADAINNNKIFQLAMSICKTELTVVNIESQIKSQLLSEIDTDLDLYVACKIVECVGNLYE